MAFRWRANDGPLLVLFGSSLTSSIKTKKKLSQLDPYGKTFLDPRMISIDSFSSVHASLTSGAKSSMFQFSFNIFYTNFGKIHVYMFNIFNNSKVLTMKANILTEPYSTFILCVCEQQWPW